MSTSQRLTLARLQEILRRQDPPQWGSLYEPAIRATREEAPSSSRYLQIWFERHQRYVHVLSRAESPAAMLAMMNPMLFEMHEQRMLTMEERPHPLAGHRSAVGLDLPPLMGTIQVAERLDLFSHHAWFRHRPANSNEEMVLPFPFIGDLLLFLDDEHGPYCVNWTIKKTEEDFSRSMSTRKRIRDPEKDAVGAKARHAIEDLYYRDAGIRTVRVVQETIPDVLAHNIRNLVLYQRLAHAMAPGILSELDDRLQASFVTGETPLNILLSIVHRRDCDFEHLRCAFFHMLWHRRVCVDLMCGPLLIDRPLRPERINLFEHFSSLFSRTGG